MDSRIFNVKRVIPTPVFDDWKAKLPIKPYGYIYWTVNIITQKVYIGKHKYPVHDKNYIGSGKILRQAIAKYGYEYFINFPVQWCYSYKELNEAEKSWIKKYNAQKSKDFYNIASGGEYGDVWAAHDEEWKEHQRKIRSENSKGHVTSEETKRKMSLAKIGKIFSYETREKLRKRALGRKHSPETIAKFRATRKIQMQDENIRKNISEATKKALAKPEIRQKLSELGKKYAKRGRENQRVKANMIPLIADNVKYDCLKDARKAYHIGHKELKHRLNSDEWPTWRYVEK